MMSVKHQSCLFVLFESLFVDRPPAMPLDSTAAPPSPSVVDPNACVVSELLAPSLSRRILFLMRFRAVHWYGITVRLQRYN